MSTHRASDPAAPLTPSAAGEDARGARRPRCLAAGLGVALLLAATGCGTGVRTGEDFSASDTPPPTVGRAYTFSLDDPATYQRVFAAPASTPEVPNPDTLYVTVRAGADGARVALYLDAVPGYSKPYTLQAQQSAVIRLVASQSANLQPLEGASRAAVTVVTVSIVPS